MPAASPALQTMRAPLDTDTAPASSHTTGRGETRWRRAHTIPPRLLYCCHRPRPRRRPATATPSGPSAGRGLLPAAFSPPLSYSPSLLRQRAGAAPRRVPGLRGRGWHSSSRAEEAGDASSLTAAYSRLAEEAAPSSRQRKAVALGAVGRQAGEISCCLAGCGFWWAARSSSGQLGCQRDSQKPPAEGPVPGSQQVSSWSLSAAEGLVHCKGLWPAASTCSRW